MVRAAAAACGREVAIMADLQGPKIRVGKFKDGKIELVKGAPFILDATCELGDQTRAGLDYKELPRDLKPSDVLLLNDGLIVLIVDRVQGSEIFTTVKVGGELSNNKGINRQGGGLSAPALTAKDMEDIKTAMQLGADYVAVSFPKSATDMIMARQLANIAAETHKTHRPLMIAKIERAEAIPVLQEILDASDGIMVARGDLGVDLPPEDVPLAQKRIIRLSRQLGRPVVVATQMLESMISAPAPTRAEASDVATAVFDGADAVMLSAETAAGQYPFEAVNIMDRIIARTEGDQGWRATIEQTRPDPEHSTADAIAQAARAVAHTIQARVICGFTASGSTALRAARERPEAPILGLTPSLETARRLAVVWGVHACIAPEAHSMTETVSRALRLAQSEGFATHGEDVVVIAGVPFGQAGTTNALRVARVR